MKYLICWVVLFNSVYAFAEEEKNLESLAPEEIEQPGPSEFSLWKDTKKTFKYMIQGSYKQFTQRNNLYYLGAGIAGQLVCF